MPTSNQHRLLRVHFVDLYMAVAIRVSPLRSDPKSANRTCGGLVTSLLTLMGFSVHPPYEMNDNASSVRSCGRPRALEAPTARSLWYLELQLIDRRLRDPHRYLRTILPQELVGRACWLGLPSTMSVGVVFTNQAFENHRRSTIHVKTENRYKTGGGESNRR